MLPTRARFGALAVVFFILLAFTLRVYRSDAQSLWYDEGYSAYLGAHLPVGQALDLTARDVVPPLYYLLLRPWLALVGTSEFALRYLSVLFGVVGVALLAQVGRRLGGERTGLVGAALGASAPVLLWLAQDARMYGPLVTWSLLASWGLVRATAPGADPKSRRRGWAIFVAGGLAALYTHTVAAFWLLGQAAFALLTVVWRRERNLAIETLVALGLLAVGYLPWVGVAFDAYQANTGYWAGYLPPRYLWRSAWETFVGGQHLSPAQTGAAALWFGAAALLSWLGVLVRRPRVAAYLFCYLALPLLAMGIAFQHTPKLAARYPTAMAPALLLILALSEGQRASRVLRFTNYVLRFGIASFFFLAAANLYSNPTYSKDDWRAVADYVRTHRQSDEAIILVSGHAFPVFAYYYGWEGWQALPADVQLDVTHVLHYPTVAPRLNHILDGDGGAWLVLWQDEVVDPTGLVSTLLDGASRTSSELTWRGATVGDTIKLEHFRFEQPIRLPDHLPIQQRLDQSVAPGLTLLGYTLPVTSHPADAEIHLRAFWQAEEPLSGAYAGSLRLFDRLGQEWARADSFLAGDYLTERWPVDVPVLGQYSVALPPGTPPGVYTPTLMIYQEDETFGALALSPLVITRPFTVPIPANLGLRLIAAERPPTAEIALVGVGFDQETVTPCQDWFISLAWQAGVTPTQDFRLRLNAGPDQVETPLAPDHPTTRWQAGDVWRTRHRLFINCRALDETLPVTLQLLGDGGQFVGEPVELGAITVVAGRQFAPPQDLTSVAEIELPGVGKLLGYRLEKVAFDPGENLEITLYWRADHTTERNYSVFVHVQRDGRVYAQHDGWPGEGQKPTSAWAWQEVISDRHVVPLGADLPTGEYQLVVGMYDAETLQPVPAFDPPGQPVAEGRMVLQSIHVSAP